MITKGRLILLLALLLIIAGAALAASYQQQISFSATLKILLSKLASGVSYSGTLNLILSKLQQIGAYTISLGIFKLGLAQNLQPSYTVSLGLFTRQPLPGPGAQYGTGLSLFINPTAQGLIPYGLKIGICCNFSAPPGDGGGGGRDIIIRGDPALSFALMLALIGVPALLLASAAGPPGLFVGLLIGGGMAFMAGLLPLWLIVLLGLAVITLIAFMIRSRHD